MKYKYKKNNKMKCKNKNLVFFQVQKKSKIDFENFIKLKFCNESKLMIIWQFILIAKMMKTKANKRNVKIN